MSRNTTATINLSALAQNVVRVKSMVPDSKLMAVVKADAYGHGLKRCLPALTEADLLAVATLNEARCIRDLNADVPVLLLQGVTGPDELKTVSTLQLEMVVHQPAQLDWIESTGRPAGARMWLKIDSGMHRLGFPSDQVQPLYERIAGWPGVKDVVLMSHFACADEPGHPLNQRQLKAFEHAVEGVQAAHCLANSAAILNFPESHRQWVRAGLMLYGISPLPDSVGSELGLKPVMQLDSKLIAINQIKAGETIGYGARFRAPTDMRIGVVAIGYGDGYPRNMPDGTPVLVNGKKQPVVGRVSMDMMTVDLTDQPEAGLGDPVTLWGGDLAVEDIAQAVDTIPYELICRVTRRVRYQEIEYLRNKPRN